MRIGSADGPGKDRAHKTTHVIYDTRSGHIVATHQFRQRCSDRPSNIGWTRS